jgi:hypothetical protein
MMDIDGKWLHMHWLHFFIIGLVMMTIGIITQSMVELTMETAFLTNVSSGIGLILAFMSVISFRGSWEKPNPNEEHAFQ